jgi:hypothetical protein
MATGKSVGTIVKIMGHSHGTSIGQLISIFNVLGIKTKENKLTRWNKNLGNFPPKFALLHKLYHKKGEHYHGHWLLMWNGILHDPAMAKSRTMQKEGRITSYIELIPRKGTKK